MTEGGHRPPAARQELEDGMDIDRAVGKAPRTKAVGQVVSGLQGGCVGCPDCAGLCSALLEAIYLPEMVLKQKST